MNPKDRIQKDIEGLEGLLTGAIRIQNPKYMRMIRKDIEGLQRELRIQRVKERASFLCP
jgi:hypothetical protein